MRTKTSRASIRRSRRGTADQDDRRDGLHARRCLHRECSEVPSPENRNPDPDEIESCEPFLFRQIETIKPKVIVALGAFAAKTLLRSAEPISKLRGNVYDYHGAQLIPTFHPSFLLRSPGQKKFAWEDLKKALSILAR